MGVRLLESLGAEVDVAENGYVALSLLQQVGVNYDVVFSVLSTGEFFLVILEGVQAYS